jgi:putative tryptophan/tyrosine transport system substrate-binding protein
MPAKTIVGLLVGLTLASVHLAEGQQAKKVARVGYLSLRFPPPPSVPLHRYDEAFYQGLREVGYIEGKNLIVEYRYSEGNPERFPHLARELVSSNVDLIIATSTPAIRAARQATTTIPIVMFSAGDPVSAEFIDSLSRPGGNVTGVTGVFPAFSGKLLQLLVDAVPGLTRVGVLRDLGSDRLQLAEAEDVARALRVRPKILEVRNHDELDKAFIAATKDRTHGLLVLPGLTFTMNQKKSRNFQSRADCRRFTGKEDLPKRAAFWLMALALPICLGAWVCL